MSRYIDYTPKANANQAFGRAGIIVRNSLSASPIFFFFFIFLFSIFFFYLEFVLHLYIFLVALFIVNRRNCRYRKEHLSRWFRLLKSIVQSSRTQVSSIYKNVFFCLLLFWIFYCCCYIYGFGCAK